jgi:hypothetical protein
MYVAIRNTADGVKKYNSSFRCNFFYAFQNGREMLL